MKKHFIFFTIIFAVTILFCACGKDEHSNPFDGRDNHITSFIIKKEGVSYVATISENIITVSVPINVDLSDAQAQYTLCEHASILPKPAEITNWNDEQIFKVKSYNKVSRNYSYVIKRTEIHHGGNVLLLTQQDVDAFAGSGSTVVEGNLVIGTSGKPDPETSIVSLEGLSSIKEVKYHIIINSSFAGADLSGLRNIEKCGGFYIGNTTRKIALAGIVDVSLPSLSIAGDVVLNSDSIQSVSLPVLESTSNLQISSSHIAAAELPQLREVAGDLLVKNESNVMNSTLSKIDFPELTYVGGSLFMHYFSRLNSVKFSKLKQIGGGIDVALNSTLFETLEFSALETVNGTINIERAPALLSVSLPKVKRITSFIFNKISYGNYPLSNLDLSSLESVADEFYIRAIPLETFALPKLMTIGGNMTIWDLKSMETFKAPKLTSIGGQLYFSSASLLSSLDLTKLDALNTLYLSGCLSLDKVMAPKTIENLTINFSSNANCPLPEFVGLETVPGEVKFTSCSNTVNYELKNITKVGTLVLNEAGAENSTVLLQDMKEIGTLLVGSYRLIEFSAPELTTIGDFKLSSVWSLKTILIPKLKTIKNLSLSEHASWNSSNARMTELDAFSGVTSIEMVEISYCAKLVDFSGLANAISKLSAHNWSVTNCAYNPSFQDVLDGKYVQPE